MRRIVQGAITLVFWLVWIYLMLPLVAPFMALAGLEYSLFAAAAPEDYLRFLYPVLLLVGTLMITMEIWVMYNVFLHRWQRRKVSLKGFPRDKIASHFGVSPEKLAGCHASPKLTIHMTKQGTIYDLRTGEAGGGGATGRLGLVARRDNRRRKAGKIPKAGAGQDSAPLFSHSGSRDASSLKKGRVS